MQDARANIAWMILVLAGLFEIGWAISLKYTDGFSRMWPVIGVFASMTASVVLLAISVKVLPVGTAYAVWTGIGILGTTILGIVLFGEPTNAARLICMLAIFGGILGLKLS